MLICPRLDVMVLLRNISWPPTVHIHKAGLKDLHNLISTHTPHRLPFFPAPLYSPHIPCCLKYQALHGTSTPQHVCPKVTSEESEVPKAPSQFLFFPSPDQHMGLLNTCIWEALLLSRLYNLLPYQVLGHHPASLLISHFFFYLLPCIWVLSRYFLGRPSPMSSGPELFPSPAALDVDSNLNLNLYLDTYVALVLVAAVTSQLSQGSGENDNLKASVPWSLPASWLQLFHDSEANLKGQCHNTSFSGQKFGGHLIFFNLFYTPHFTAFKIYPKSDQHCYHPGNLRQYHLTFELL